MAYVLLSLEFRRAITMAIAFELSLRFPDSSRFVTKDTVC